MDIFETGTLVPHMIPTGSQRQRELNSIFGSLEEGTSTLLYAGGIVNSYLASAHVAHQATAIGHQALWLVGPNDTDRKSEIVAVLQSLFGLTVSVDEIDSFADVSVVPIDDFVHEMYADETWYDYYVIFDNADDLVSSASPYRFAHDAMRNQGQTVMVLQRGGSEPYEHSMFDRALDPFVNRLHDNAGDTPFHDRAGLARARVQERYEPDPALSCTENDYGFIRKGTLAERYRVLSELVGFAVQLDEGPLWVIDRYNDLFSGTNASFGPFTLAGWVYATAPRSELVETFPFDMAAAMGDAMPA